MNAAHYDAVVIGSGFGGSLVAHALVQAGLKDRAAGAGPVGQARRRGLGSAHHLIEATLSCGLALLVKQYGRRTFQRTYPNEVVGGNSVFFGGASLRLRPADFARWPFSYADLAPYYARAEQLLGVHGEVGTDPHEPPGLETYPRRAVELSAPAQRIYQAGTALGLRPVQDSAGDQLFRPQSAPLPALHHLRRIPLQGRGQKRHRFHGAGRGHGGRTGDHRRRGGEAAGATGRARRAGRIRR